VSLGAELRQAEAAKDTKHARKRFDVKRGLRWGISLAAVGFIAWMLPIRDRCNAVGVCEDGLLTTFKRANVLLVMALFGVYLASTIAWSARWRALLRLADVELAFRAAWRLTLEAQAGGVLLPGGVGGDALRVAYVKERVPSVSVAKIAASIMADRALGLVTLALMALGLALLFDPGKDLRIAMPMLAGIPFGAVCSWVVLRQAVKSDRVRRMRLLQGKLGSHLVLPLLEYASSPVATSVILRGLLLSILVSAAQLLVVRGLVAALGVSPNGEAWLFVGVAFAMVVSALPTSPGAWGTAEAAYVFFLGRAGVPAPAATAVCLLYRLMWYATGSIGAVSALARADRGERS
jgi:uncharacterized protein (TIRG00374 family)